MEKLLDRLAFKFQFDKIWFHFSQILTMDCCIEFSVIAMESESDWFISFKINADCSAKFDKRIVGIEIGRHRANKIFILCFCSHNTLIYQCHSAPVWLGNSKKKVWSRFRLSI